MAKKNAHPVFRAELTCEICGKTAKGRGNLNKHMRNQHPQEAVITASNSNLVDAPLSPKNSASQEKNEEADVEAMNITASDSMEVPLPLEDPKFQESDPANQLSLTTKRPANVNTNTKESEYDSFGKISNECLKFHILIIFLFSFPVIITMEKPAICSGLACEICGKTIRSKAQLDKHMQNHHNKDKAITISDSIDETEEVALQEPQPLTSTPKRPMDAVQSSRTKRSEFDSPPPLSPEPRLNLRRTETNENELTTSTPKRPANIILRNNSIGEFDSFGRIQYK